jgi:hypothetical protein
MTAQPSDGVFFRIMCVAKKPYKPKAKLSRTPAKALHNRGQMVRDLAAAGDSGDVIAAKLQLNKNRLRAEHALELHAGRKFKQAERAAAEALSRKDRERIEAITRAWHSDWYDPEIGECLLFPDCKSLEEALEQSKKHWK